MAKTEKPTRDYRQQVVDQLIEAMENNNAPWQIPWEQGKLYQRPHNPITNKPYRGINSLMLETISNKYGYEDPRYMTYKQASELGGQVRRGEKSTPIEYWQWSKSIKAVDEQGKTSMKSFAWPRMQRSSKPM